MFATLVKNKKYLVKGCMTNYSPAKNFSFTGKFLKTDSRSEFPVHIFKNEAGQKIQISADLKYVTSITDINDL